MGLLRRRWAFELKRPGKLGFTEGGTENFAEYYALMSHFKVSGARRAEALYPAVILRLTLLPRLAGRSLSNQLSLARDTRRSQEGTTSPTLISPTSRSDRSRYLHQPIHSFPAACSWKRFLQVKYTQVRIGPSNPSQSTRPIRPHPGDRDTRSSLEGFISPLPLPGANVPGTSTPHPHPPHLPTHFRDRDTRCSVERA
jgi:hypothetical protein